MVLRRRSIESLEDCVGIDHFDCVDWCSGVDDLNRGRLSNEPVYILLLEAID